MRASFLPAIAFVASMALAGCASTAPEAAGNGGLDKNIRLAKGGDDSTLVYRNPDIDVTKYRGIYIPPAEVYAGSDAEFGGASDEKKQEMAQFLSDEFIRVLGKNHNIAAQPGPGIVKLHLILVGFRESRPVLSTGLRLMPVGLALTLGKSVADMPASFTGSATFSCEITDSETGEVLGAFLTKQNPPAYELTSGLGETRAARLGITQGAEGFAKVLDKARAGAN
ncbi:MAG: DUF3313 domain-containing protein [Bdellovibrionales bacterium]